MVSKVELSQANKECLGQGTDKKLPRAEKVHKYTRWSKQESYLYSEFLSNNREMFKDERVRRKTRVFKRLYEFVGTKNMKQCKSHHQKMIAQNGDIDNIVKKYLIPLTTEPRQIESQLSIGVEENSVCYELATPITQVQ